MNSPNFKTKIGKTQTIGQWRDERAFLQRLTPNCLAIRLTSTGGQELGRMHETLMIAKHETCIYFYGASERANLNPCASEKWLNECGSKMMAKYMNKSKNFETYYEFFCWCLIEINFSKDRNICSKLALEREISLYHNNYGLIYKYIKIYYHFAI